MKVSNILLALKSRNKASVFVFEFEQSKTGCFDFMFPTYDDIVFFKFWQMLIYVRGVAIK